MRAVRVAVVVSLLGLLGAAAPSKAAFEFREPDPSTAQVRSVSHWVDWLTWCHDCYTQPGTQARMSDAQVQAHEPWVTNPTACPWDTDDRYYWTASGTLGARSSASMQDCSYESSNVEPNPNVSQSGVIHVTYVVVYASTDKLRITTTFAWRNGTATFGTPSPTWDGKSWVYRQCVVVNSVNGGVWEEVPGSHGGYAVAVRRSTTVSNPTGKPANHTAATVAYGWIPWWSTCRDSVPAFPPPLGA